MRLPRTSESRRQRGFLRLLTDVDLHHRFGHPVFDGQLLTPGAVFSPADLPCPAVLLEYAGRIRTAAKPPTSRYSFSDLWLLWRFDFESAIWIEVVRAPAQDNSWRLDFGQIARRLLFAERTETGAERARPTAERVTSALGVELDAMTSEMRCHVLAALDQYVAGEIVRSARPLGLRVSPFRFLRHGFAPRNELPVIVCRRLAQLEQMPEQVLRSEEFDAQLPRLQVDPRRQIRDQHFAHVLRRGDPDLSRRGEAAGFLEVGTEAGFAGLLEVVVVEHAPQTTEDLQAVAGKASVRLLAAEFVEELDGAAAANLEDMLEDFAVDQHRGEGLKISNYRRKPLNPLRKDRHAISSVSRSRYCTGTAHRRLRSWSRSSSPTA
jgi:hypothetical protein